MCIRLCGTQAVSPMLATAENLRFTILEVSRRELRDGLDRSQIWHMRAVSHQPGVVAGERSGILPS